MQLNKHRRKLRSALGERSAGKMKSRSFNSNLAANYETMLRLYLINKEEATKKALPYIKLDDETESNAALSSVWNNLVQVWRKSGHLISAFRPGISIANN